MENSQEILQQLLDSYKHLIKELEQQNAELEQLSAETKQLSAETDSLVLELKEVKEQNSFLIEEVFRLMALYKVLTQRFDDCEDKLGLLDEQFKGINSIIMSKIGNRVKK